MSEQDAQDPRSKKRFTDRGTGFLSLSGSYSGKISTSGGTQSPPSQDNQSHANTSDYSNYSEEGYQQDYQQQDYQQERQIEEPPPEPPKKKTGVISSTIHYPPKKEAPTQQAARTGPIDEADLPDDVQRPIKKKALTEEEKLEKLDKTADRITDLLAKIDQIKTGLFSPDISFGRKIGLLFSHPKLQPVFGVVLRPFRPAVTLWSAVRKKQLQRKGLLPKPSEIDAEAMEDQGPPPPEKISFLELAEKNIIFCDNRKRPLYTLEQLRGKHGYTASEEVIAPMIYENILAAFREVAPKAKAIPTPEKGMYAGIPMVEVMESINEEHVLLFLNYVKRFPRGYVGKNFRITESFAGWVVSGTPDD